MTFLYPHAFYLAFAGLLIALLHFLRSRERQREVSSLVLWEGLPGEPQSRAARLRQQLDPLLLLQLAALLALVAALSQPLVNLPSRTYSGVAVVIDASASMRTLDESGQSRYERAIEQAVDYLDEHASDEIVIIQHSAHPSLLLASTSSEADAEAALRSSEPTWYGDGNTRDLDSLIGSVGGAGHFDRILYVSDHAIEGLPSHSDVILTQGGFNLALTQFSVRQNETSPGVTAFIELTNDSTEYVDAHVRVSDGENQTTLQSMLSPKSVDQQSIPFPTSRGTVFTATVEPTDDFTIDNVRFYSLDRPIDIRIFWVGEQNRYLLTALRAVAPVTRVDDIERADLVIAEDEPAPPIDEGVALLVNSGMEGVLTIGRPVDALSAVPTAIEHDLLRAVSAEDFRVRQVPETVFSVPYETLIEVAGLPLLAESVDARRRLIFLTADLMSTNLPITVDFPILVRNIVNELVRVPAVVSADALHTGDFVDLSGRGAIEQLTDGNGNPVEYSQALESFRADGPGIYTLQTDRGAYALAVNIPASESRTIEDAGSSRVEVRAESANRQLALWPWLSALAILLLVLEILLHFGVTPQFRRTP